MSPAMLLGTAGDHIEVVIGVLLGLLFVLWALTAFVQWLKTSPWKQNGARAGDAQAARREEDGDQHSDGVPRNLHRLVAG